MTIAFFDFDGTITRKDSLIEFIKYAKGNYEFYRGLFEISPILLQYKLRLVSNHEAKERLISHFFKGCDILTFQKISHRFALEELDKIIRPRALEKIRWHQEKGDKVLIVTASLEDWIKEWCKREGIELIGTKLEIEDEKITGNFATANCYGQEKVKRILELYDLDDYEIIYAYGDSKGDKELLEQATESFYRHF